MRKLDDINIPPDWQQVIYSEAWNQYCHEDNIGVKRMQIFTAVNSGFIAILTLIAKPLIGLPPLQVGFHHLHIGLALLAGFMMIIGVLSFFLSWVWRSLMKSSRRYLNLRWFPIYAIEKLAKLNDLGLGVQEDRWKRFSSLKTNRKKKFPIYDDIEELAEQKFTLGSLPLFRAWTSLETLTWIFQVISVLLVIAGIVFIFLTRAVWCGLVIWPN